MSVQRFKVFGWANPVEGGDGPFGGTFVKESDYDALAARLAEAEDLLTQARAMGVLEGKINVYFSGRAADSASE